MTRVLIVSTLPKLPFQDVLDYDRRVRIQAVAFGETVVAHLFTHTLEIPFADYQFDKIIFITDYGVCAGMTLTHRRAREKNIRLEMRWLVNP